MSQNTRKVKKVQNLGALANNTFFPRMYPGIVCIGHVL